MIVDTNFVLRLLDGSRGAHARAARGRIEAARERDERFTLTAATALEVVYVLESTGAGFAWEREDVAAALDAVLDEPAFAVEDGRALRRAVALYRQRSVDLHDCYLAARAELDSTKVLSFDADFTRLGIREKP